MIALLQNLRQEAAGGLKRWRRGGGRSNYAALRAAGVVTVKLRAANNDDLSGWLSIKQSCKNVQTVRTSRCYFFWPVLIFGKSTRKTGENRRKQAKNRRSFGANFFGGKIGRC